jgi:putative hemolysin
LATGHPERIAAAVAGPMRLLSVVAAPVVRLLSVSTRVVLRLIGTRPSTEPTVTEEEVKAMVEEGTRVGVFEEVEHDMVKRVFRLGDRRASALMTPRTEVVWLDAADPPEEIRRKITASPHSRFPVCGETLDHVLGIVHVKDILIHGFAGKPFDIRGLLTMPLFIYEGKPGLEVLEAFKKSGTHIAIVLDEYGSVEGLLTLNDILEAIVGDMPTEAEAGDQRAVRRHDGTWLLDGTLTTGEFRDLFEPVSLPEGRYETLAGFVITQLGRIPMVADRFDWDSFRFEVMDMDGNRIDKVLVSRPGEVP